MQSVTLQLHLHAGGACCWLGDNTSNPCAVAPADTLIHRQCLQYRHSCVHLAGSPPAVEELCAFRWRFCFKPQAGDYWLGLTAGLSMERLFSEDGSVSAPPDDVLWGEGQTGAYGFADERGRGVGWGVGWGGVGGQVAPLAPELQRPVL